MQLNHVLTLNPTIFPTKMATIQYADKIVASTKSIAKYLGELHTWVNCTTAWVAEEVQNLTVEQLTQLSEKFKDLDINLTLQDSIFDTRTEEGYLLDVFGYALVIRCMNGGDFYTHLTNLLTEMAMQKRATRSNGKSIMPRKVAIEILKAHGVAGTSDTPSCEPLMIPKFLR